MRDIPLAAAARALRNAECNFLRRGADLSLSMSGARWRLTAEDADTLTFQAVAPDGTTLPDTMVLALPDVERITWDRLPRQQQRSQVRFHLNSGETWTFSGTLDEPSPD